MAETEPPGADGANGTTPGGAGGGKLSGEPAAYRLPVATLGVTRETRPGERRVAATPTSVGLLVKAGLEVRVEEGAGGAAGFSDDAYADRGAAVVSRGDAS